MLNCTFGDFFHFLAVGKHGIVIVFFPILASVFRTAANFKAVCHSIGIAGNKKLGKNDELGSVCGTFVNESESLSQALFLIEYDGSCLNYGNFASAL